MSNPIFVIKEMTVMVEMFAPCPKCNLQYLIVYDNGDKVCTHCGYQSSVTRVGMDDGV